METSIQAPGEASAEAQEILKEMEAEGLGTPAGKEPEAPKEKPEPEKAEAKPEAKPEDPKPKETQPERTERHVPVSKHNEERHKRQEAENRAKAAEARAAELEAKLSGQPDRPAPESPQAIKEAAMALASKHDLDPEFVTELLETANKLSPKQQGLTPEQAEAIEALRASKAQADSIIANAKQDEAFNAEFSGILKEFPDLADRKEELKELAFSEGNVNTSLRRIALEYLHDNQAPKGRKTAEAPAKGRGDAQEVVDFADMTDEKYKSLSYEQMDRYDEWRAKNGR